MKNNGGGESFILKKIDRKINFTLMEMKDLNLKAKAVFVFHILPPA
jgi:hypothetical protein